MRGDRPRSIQGSASAPWATPHARGSTQLIQGMRRGNHGYPACAGIDPETYLPLIANLGLPRMRGDRPNWHFLHGDVISATPHARGSTFKVYPLTTIREGYPACAGIDPCSKRVQSYPDRLPRMRGDRPCTCAGSARDTVATPHARGSTRFLGIRTPGGYGYPACAGIDLLRRRIARLPRRLPRMRGDRPLLDPLPCDGGVATPHARGSTRLDVGAGGGAHGYPACAGIDRIRAA